jgi:hypothetical protein
MDPSQNPASQNDEHAAQNPASQQAQNAFKRLYLEDVQAPSLRTPNLSWGLNTADQLESCLKDDGHQTWGFVIYRSTYNSDADWAAFLQRLRVEMEDTFDFYNGRDILEKFSLTVFEDRSLFDGASTNAIRQHFLQWSATAYRTEQQPDQGSLTPIRVSIGRSPRYRYAIQVDAESLHSIVHESPPPVISAMAKDWVKLIDKSWYLGRSEESSNMLYPLEPVEGVTEPDVGWMRVKPLEAMTSMYVSFRYSGTWGDWYRRPPKIVK